MILSLNLEDWNVCSGSRMLQGSILSLPQLMGSWMGDKHRRNGLKGPLDQPQMLG